MGGVKGQFRPDVDGLRTVAVAAVVAFHAGVPGFHAGFVGVDVFFVISGFLINRLLLRELAETGTIALLPFWARRARRLLPASAAMVLAVLAASWLLLPPLRWERVAKAAVAASAYLSNALFARQSTNYFAADLAPNPLLHTWSLAVEEQFYIAWPIMLLLAMWLGRRTGQPRRWLVIAIVGGALVSFAGCLWFTQRGSPWAFFGSPVRAWEFAAGAMIALWEPACERRGQALHGWAGLALLVAGLAIIDESWRFPGVAALFPVLATVLLIVGGGRGLVGRALTTAPMQWLGKRSYAWYLWHWPAIRFADDLFPQNELVKYAAVALSLVVAAITYALVEQPIRFHPGLVRSTRRSLALAVGTVVIGGVVGAAHWGAYRWAATREPVASALAARKDRVAVSGCEDLSAGVVPAVCAYGDATATRTVLLVGDSHAMQWVPAFDIAGQRVGVRVVFMGMSACPALPFRVVDKAGASRGACKKFQESIVRTVQAIRPELVVTSNYSGYVDRRRAIDDLGRRRSIEDGVVAWGQAVAGLAAGVHAAGADFLVVADPPILRMDPIDCLSSGAGADACTSRAR